MSIQAETTHIQNRHSEKPSPKKPKARRTGVFMSFLGSMNLAVTLLVMLSIASVIGTVLQQNQSIQDYILKFGPFWHEVFNMLGLFHVYGAAWFVLVLLFLLLSTSACVVRHAPKFSKDMRQFNESMSKKAIRLQNDSAQFETVLEFEKQQAYAEALLKHKGFKTKINQRRDGSVTVAGLKGAYNRLGYFFTHISIVIICFGGLLDSNLLLKFREITGDLVPETRSISLDEVPQESWLGPENLSFRGSVTIPEGDKTDVLFLPYENGYLVQKLPFTIVNNDFSIDYYDTGMPKTYKSELVLTDPEREEPIKQVIEVNKPLYYKDYAIYQSSFGDGGTELKLHIHPLLSPVSNVISLDTAINKVEPLKTPMGVFKAEFSDFKMHNIVPNSEEDKQKTGRQFHNNGPTMIFKVRNDEGKAWEYENYMMPSLQEERWFFMSGVRSSAADPFRYLFIPADENRQKKRFFDFLVMINNPLITRKVMKQLYPADESIDQTTYNKQLRLMEQLQVLFRQKGFKGIEEFVQKSVPEEERQRVEDFYYGQTSLVLQTLYMELLIQEGKAQSHNDEISEFDERWFEDALSAFSGILAYGPPMYFEMKSFTEIQATGLQITKSPGKDVVYFGSTLLIIGVFFLFYLRQRRVWVLIERKEDGEGLTVTMAAKDNKKLPETTKEFELLVEKVKEYNTKTITKEQVS